MHTMQNMQIMQNNTTETISPSLAMFPPQSSQVSIQGFVEHVI